MFPYPILPPKFVKPRDNANKCWGPNAGCRGGEVLLLSSVAFKTTQEIGIKWRGGDQLRQSAKPGVKRYGVGTWKAGHFRIHSHFLLLARIWKWKPCRGNSISRKFHLMTSMNVVLLYKGFLSTCWQSIMRTFPHHFPRIKFAAREDLLNVVWPFVFPALLMR